MKRIVQFDVDEATYVGSGEDGVYYQVGEHEGKWYVTAVVDSETGAFTEDIMTDDGPYDTENDATTQGKNIAYDWCFYNNVSLEDEQGA